MYTPVGSIEAAMLRGLQRIVEAVEVHGGGQAAASGQVEAVGPASAA